MRKSCVAVSFLALLLLTFMTACGGGSAPISVAIAQPGATSIPAGSAAVTLTANVAHDSKSGGVSWSLAPVSGCGVLSNTSTTSATYTPPANTITADCTATITAASVDDSTKTTTLVLTMKAITVSVASSAGSTTTFGSGAAAVTLTATLNNEATGSTDSVTWNLVASGSQPGVTRRGTRSARPAVVSETCGTLVPSDSNPLVATYTPPAAVPGTGCTATITAASKANGNLSTKAYTVNAIVLAITSPTAPVTEYADKGAISLTSTITNDGASAGVTWALAAGSCGTLVQSGTSALYTPPASPAAQCGAVATVSSVTDPSKTLTAPAITINPNITVAFNPAPPTAMSEGSRLSITVSIANDLSTGGVNWTVNPATGCGSLSSAALNGVTYTAGPALTGNCTAVIKATSVTDSLQSVSASIAITATGVSITSPTSAQQVANSAVVPLTATISDDGSGGGISWAIAPPAGCGILSSTSGAAINYTAPAEANLPKACTAMITASSTYDSTKTAGPVSITANPIAISAITSPGITFPATVGQASQALALTASVSYDPAPNIGWNIVPNDNSCGSLGSSVMNGNSSTAPFLPPSTVTSKCTATISAIDAADTSKSSSAQITVVPLTVTITTPATSPVSVNEGSTQPLVATVLGDVANAGITWALNPTTCGTLSTTAAVSSGTSVTFTAPAPTVAACSVTATATSVSDHTKTANVTLNVVPPAISVSFTNPGPWNMDASNSNGNSTIQVGAAVTNDIGNQGVNWQSNNSCATLTPSGTGNLSLTITAVQDSTLNTGTNCTMTVTAVSAADSTKNAQTTLTVTPISVNITPGGNQSYSQGAGNVNFTAVANNDALGYPATGASGVTWSLSNTNGCGSLSNNTTTSVTYVVPTSVSSTCTTQLVATSVADGTKSNFDTISVYPPGPALTIDPTQGGNKSQYYGVQNQGFQLSLNVNGGTPPYTFTTASGAIPPGMSYSSSTASYASNSLVGAPTASGAYTFTVKVTDAANNTATSPSVSLNVNAGPNHQHDSYLNGRYVCLTKGYEDATQTTAAFPWTALASVPMTGTSTFTGGISDLVTGGGSYPGILASTTETGTVNIGSDNHGIMTLTTSGTGASLTTTWAVRLNNLAGPTATEVHGIEIDDVGTSPSTQHAEVSCYLATASAFTSTTVNGHSFAFGIGGVGNNGSKTSVGMISFTSGGAASGVADTLKNDGTYSNSTISGSIASGPDATTGRMKVTLGKSGTITDDLIVYLIDTNRAVAVLVGDPSVGTDGMQSGNMRTQKQTTYSNANFNGPFVAYYHSTEYSSGSVIDYNSSLIQGKGDGSTGVTINVNYQDQANVTSSGNGSGSLTGGVLAPPMSVPLTVGSNGRAVYQPTGNTAFTSIYFYLYDNNSAFIMDGTEGLGVGWVDPQTATTSTNPAGSYLMYDLPASDPNTDDNQNQLTLSGGTITGTGDSANQNWFEWNQPINQGGGTLTYTGPTTFDLLSIGNSGKPTDCILITAVKAACISADDNPNINIMVQ